jgi:hypothetical protein
VPWLATTELLNLQTLPAASTMWPCIPSISTIIE